VIKWAALNAAPNPLLARVAKHVELPGAIRTHNWPRLVKVKGKKRAAGVPAASVVTAVDLGGEEGGAPPAKRSNSSLFEQAVYAMGPLAGDPRANAHYIELHKEDVAWRATSCVSAQEYSCAVCAWISFVKKLCTMICALIACAPCQASSSSCSQSPHLHDKGLLHPLAQSSFIPPSTSPFDSRLSRESFLML